MTKTTFLSREPAWSDADFIGRDDALTWLAGQLGRAIPQNCNIVGEPRIGKTSLLHAAYRRRVGLPAGATGIYIWARLVEWANRGPVAFWLHLLGRVRSAAEASNIGLPRLSDQPSNTPWLAYQALETILEHIQARQPNVRVIVFIDDFELLIPDISAQGLDWLRALATRFAAQFALVITSSDPLERVCRPLGAETVSPLYNIFTIQHLGLLAETEAASLIQTAAEAEGQAPITAGMARFLREEVGRHPDLLKLGCDYLFQLLGKENELTRSDEILDALRSDIRSDAHIAWLCERLYQRRSAEERAFLLALLHGAPTMDPLLLRPLERKLGLVETHQGQVRLFADACRYWLARHHQVAGPAETDTKPDIHYQAELREVRVGDRVRKLSAVEDRLFQHLLSKPDQVCTPQELLDHVWGAGRTLAVVEKTVNRLRDKVEEDPARPRLILSVRGEGYLLRAPTKG